MSSKPKIFLSSPHLGTQEFEFVREAFATNWIAPLGPHVDAFEKEFGQSLQEGTELTEIGRKEAQKAQESEDGGRKTEGESLRAEGPSQTHGLESPCHVAWAFQPMSGRQRIAGRSVTR